MAGKTASYQGFRRWRLSVTAGLVAAVVGGAGLIMPPSWAVTDATPATTQAGPLPFAMPAQATLRGSAKKVFAHYFTQFPISLDNKPSESDYYARNYLTPGGESGKHAAYGGFLRNRPLPRAVLTGDWALEDMKTEVRRAAAAGIDGFTIDLLNLSGYHFERTKLLIKAAEQVDPGFRIVLMPDMTSIKTGPDDLAAKVASLAASPVLHRLGDGRLVISPFKAENQTATWWKSWMDTMRTQYGVSIALVPCFLNWRPYAESFAPISYGFANWGNRNPKANASLNANITDAHAMGKIWMQPVSAQDARPNQGIYDEANNTENLRVTWQAAIGGADWVQLTTWNDYSEGTTFAPSAYTGWTFLDLSSYYLTRFKTGAFPALTGDALYLTHRVHPTSATPTGGQTKLMKLRSGSSPARDTVEVVSMLAQAGTVRVTIGGQVEEYAAPAGLAVRLFPLRAGASSAALIRAGATVATVVSPWAVTGQPAVQNLEYRAAGSRR